MSDDKPIYEEVDDYSYAPDVGREDYKEEKAPRGHRHRGSRSTFGPIVLIAGGVFFLLANLGVIDALDWQTALRFWPLALIFLGLNVLAVQLRPPAGTMASTLVALAAVGTFGYLLLSGPPTAAMRSLGLPEPAAAELKTESFRVPLDGVRTAEIEIDLSNFPAEIAPATDGGLIGGTIYTYGELEFDYELEDGHASYEVGERSSSWLFNPESWVSGDTHAWTIGLSPDVPIDLDIDSGNGAITAELSALTLTNLDIDAGNGRVNVTLPGGNYNAEVDAGNGPITVGLPPSGRSEVRIDGGNGRIELSLPAGMEARVVYDIGNGAVTAPDRLRLISGDRYDGVYETEGYDRSADRVLVIIDSGNGAVDITTP